MLAERLREEKAASRLTIDRVMGDAEAMMKEANTMRDSVNKKEI